jgi:hypothetical protein
MVDGSSFPAWVMTSCSTAGERPPWGSGGSQRGSRTWSSSLPTTLCHCGTLLQVSVSLQWTSPHCLQLTLFDNPWLLSVDICVHRPMSPILSVAVQDGAPSSLPASRLGTAVCNHMGQGAMESAPPSWPMCHLLPLPYQSTSVPTHLPETQPRLCFLGRRLTTRFPACSCPLPPWYPLH